VSDDRIRELAALAARWAEARAKATPGPAYVSEGDDDVAMSAVAVTTEPDGGQGGRSCDFDEAAVIALTLFQHPRVADVADGRWDENAALIAMAWNDRPEEAIGELIAEVERLRAALTKIMTYRDVAWRYASRSEVTKLAVDLCGIAETALAAAGLGPGRPAAGGGG
jgi:hypothetical protein